jgi:hypothetical protein
VIASFGMGRRLTLGGRRLKLSQFPGGKWPDVTKRDRTRRPGFHDGADDYLTGMGMAEV